MKIRSIFMMCMLVLSAFLLRAEVKMPAVFGDNMVLQQQSEVAIWGWAKARASVTVTTSWNNKGYSVKADNEGYWKVKVKTPAASFNPYKVTVSDGKKITFNNVLIGEVWVCSGQSNMEMPMNGWTGQPIANGPEDILNSTNFGIRCYTMKRASKAEPQDLCEGSWEVAGVETTPKFTATGYYFARLLNRVLNVPVGLIHTSWGGTRIEAWMTKESVKDLTKKNIPQTDAEIESPYVSPTVLYNGMIHPIVGFGIRGAIWYQGEANCGQPDLYVKQFDKMVREWRAIWGVGEFPFYYCQIAPFRYANLNSALLREAQSKGMETTPNTGMAVLMDANSHTLIHPAKKKDAGERLAFWALAKTYGKDIPYRSPEPVSMTIEGRLAIISVDYVGLGITSWGKEVKNFRIAGEDGKFHPATATVTKDKIYVFSPKVEKPQIVQYCFDNTSATEIFTQDGLPMSSFRMSVK